MKIVDHTRTELIDGPQEELKNKSHTINFMGYSATIPVKDATPLLKLKHHLTDTQLQNITSILGTSVKSFDGNKIFIGTERGTRLYGYEFNTNNVSFIAIFSMGESQPGRFICLYEATLEI